MSFILHKHSFVMFECIMSVCTFLWKMCTSLCCTKGDNDDLLNKLYRLMMMKQNESSNHRNKSRSWINGCSSPLSIVIINCNISIHSTNLQNKRRMTCGGVWSSKHNTENQVATHVTMTINLFWRQGASRRIIFWAMYNPSI